MRLNGSLPEQWRHEAFDEHWKQIGIYATASYDAIPPVPVALMSSWFDAYVPTLAVKLQPIDNLVDHLALGPHRQADQIEVGADHRLHRIPVSRVMGGS